MEFTMCWASNKDTALKVIMLLEKSLISQLLYYDKSASLYKDEKNKWFA